MIYLVGGSNQCLITLPRKILQLLYFIPSISVVIIGVGFVNLAFPTLSNVKTPSD